MTPNVFASHAEDIRANAEHSQSRLPVYLRDPYALYMARLAGYYEWVDSQPGCAVPMPPEPREALVYLHLVDSPVAQALVSDILARLQGRAVRVRHPGEEWAHLISGMLVNHDGFAERVAQVHRALSINVYAYPPPLPDKQAERALKCLLGRPEGEAPEADGRTP